MEISPEEEERLHKEKERLKKNLEISELVRQGQLENAELDKQNLKERYTERLAILLVLLFCAVGIIFVLARNQS
jgi:hypothetical protein